METTLNDADPLSGYQLRLPSFEGPFDLLLRLIERSQLSITDISLVTVTSQFLARIAELGGAPAAMIAEFTAVGARLVLLKSRSLLPKPAVSDADADSAGDLARELIEYRAVKEASMILARRDAIGQGAYLRSSGVIAGAEAESLPRLARHEANALVRALRRRLSVAAAPRALIEQRPIVTIQELTRRWLTFARRESSLSFQEFGASCRDASELRAGFLALLVLIRRRSIDAEQTDPFGPITVRAAVAGVIDPEVSTGT